jgi:prophage maintenance system killer protein
LLTFLFSNGKWLKADAQELYNFTVWVAQSPSEFKEEVVAAIQKFIRNHLSDVD